ncbi:MAG: tRNA pseudouridine(38-40) synthase TruA [Bacteroidales bacterium]|nr:tRNA pseudouridine(38-40) synthase TruA [Bacteroidales bacterium]
MRRFFLHLAYNGRSFCGWQVQPNAPSVQGTLENALAVLFKTHVRLTGAGRTDTGVHAVSYYAHFDLEESQWSAAVARSGKATDALDDIYAHWVYQLNALVGAEIAVFRLFETSVDCHARFSAVERTYRYYFHLRKNPFIAECSYFVRTSLDFSAMRSAMAFLVGRRDFSAFEKLHGADNSHVCDLRRAEIQALGEERYCLVFSADRFLRNMVRAMAGTLFAVGQGRFAASDMPAILSGRDRGRAGESVPGYALFLQEVRYPDW